MRTKITETISDKRAIAKMIATNIVNNIEEQVNESIEDENVSRAAVMSQVKHILNEFY